MTGVCRTCGRLHEDCCCALRPSGVVGSPTDAPTTMLPVATLVPKSNADLRPVARSDRRSREISGVRVELADALDCYADWPAPTVIMVDGPYGLGGYPGDPPTPDGLAEFYAPHAEAWARAALPSTTLWFWGSEISWAESHPALKAAGWRYRTCHIWDKGAGHIAGNVNSRTIRGYPVVSEVCVQYELEVLLTAADGRRLPIKEWLRSEWRRAGLPLAMTNEAADVKNAATRKWFTQCHLWYLPPPDAMLKIAAFASTFGQPDQGRPYFSLDGKTQLTAEAWESLRPKWNHEHGIHNVWREPPVRNGERVKISGVRPLHGCQKPLVLMERLLRASSSEGDVVWEPFGGLASGALAAGRLGRPAFVAEVVPRYWEAAATRIEADLGAQGVLG